jgi:hypothetical protein
MTTRLAKEPFMRRSLIVGILVALVVPAAAFAATPSPNSLASETCKQLQKSMGANFALTYGTNASRSNAFGQCVVKNTAAATQQLSNAAKTCKAEQADPNFAASHGGKTFVQFYTGTNGKGAAVEKNAYGKCVSAHARAAAAAHVKALTTAARTCKADRKADAAAFAAKYGSDRNAFGRCVAAKSKGK